MDNGAMACVSGLGAGQHGTHANEINQRMPENGLLVADEWVAHSGTTCSPSDTGCQARWARLAAPGAPVLDHR